MRIFLTLLICRLTKALLRLMGRGGTALPGKLALRLCPNILGVLAHRVRTIVVTGTNGKTTSSRMVEQALSEAGVSYFANLCSIRYLFTKHIASRKVYQLVLFCYQFALSSFA